MATWILLQIWSSVLLTYPYIILIVHLFAGTFSEQDTFLGRGFFGCRGVSLSWPPPSANDEGGTSHLMWMMSKWTYRTSVWSFSRTPRCFGWGRKTDVHLGERVGVFSPLAFFSALLLLVEEILHQLIWRLHHFLLGLIHPRWLGRCLNHQQYQ